MTVCFDGVGCKTLLSWDATKFGFHLTLWSVFKKKGFFYHSGGGEQLGNGGKNDRGFDLI